MCILSPKLVECGRHRNIETITYADVLDVKGEPGNFRVSIRKRARFVDETLCTGCGICQEKCPWKADSEFDKALAKRKAIYFLYPQAVPNVPVIDKELCAYFQQGKCRACEKFCPIGAIVGVQMLGVAIGGAIGPLLGGYVFDVTHSYHFAFMVSGMCTIIALILLAFIRVPRKVLN